MDNVMNAIASVVYGNGIGLNGKLICRNPEDMKRFKDITTGGTVVCGRKTYESFPNGALLNRRNIVFSKDMSFNPDDAEVVRSLDEFKQMINLDNSDDIWVIGGEKIYRLLVPYCTYILLTQNFIYSDFDARFPKLDPTTTLLIYLSGLKHNQYGKFMYEIYKNLDVREL
jgi:dihydrofolate reductase